MTEIEPAVRGIRAIHVPEAAIVDYGRVAEVLAGELRTRGVTLSFGTPVRDIVTSIDAVTLTTRAGPVVAERVVACAGLRSDPSARWSIRCLIRASPSSGFT